MPNIKYYDPQERAREKQQSRNEDANALSIGELSADDVQRKNGSFAFGSEAVVDFLMCNGETGETWLCRSDAFVDANRREQCNKLDGGLEIEVVMVKIVEEGHF